MFCLLKQEDSFFETSVSTFAWKVNYSVRSHRKSITHMSLSIFSFVSILANWIKVKLHSLFNSSSSLGNNDDDCCDIPISLPTHSYTVSYSFSLCCTLCHRRADCTPSQYFGPVRGGSRIGVAGTYYSRHLHCPAMIAL